MSDMKVDNVFSTDDEAQDSFFTDEHEMQVFCFLSQAHHRRDVAHKAADFAGDKTGAFGLRQNKRVALSDNMSRMIGPNHPAMNPGLPLRPIGGEVSHRKASSAPKKTVRRRRKSKGGSFLPSGY